MKRKAHVSFPPPIHDALTVLAELEGLTLSELIVELGRRKLAEKGIVVEADGDQIRRALERRSGSSTGHGSGRSGAGAKK